MGFYISKPEIIQAFQWTPETPVPNLEGEVVIIKGECRKCGVWGCRQLRPSNNMFLITNNERFNGFICSGDFLVPRQKEDVVSVLKSFEYYTEAEFKKKYFEYEELKDE